MLKLPLKSYMSPVTYVTISLVKIKITLIKLEKNGKIIYEN